MSEKTTSPDAADVLRADGDRRTVHLERDFDATPEELWDAWTRPDRLARWLGVPAGPILGVTSPVRMVMGEEPDQWVDVLVTRSDPPHRLELTWGFVDEPETRLVVELLALGPGRTRVVVDHRGLGAASATGYGAGWQAFLEGALVAETGGGAGPSWDERFRRALPGWQRRAADPAA